MTTPPPDIAAIAGKLTKAQAEALGGPLHDDGSTIFVWHLRVGRGLRDLGLTTGAADQLTAMTPLGQAVRAHLLGERKDG